MKVGFMNSTKISLLLVSFYDPRVYISMNLCTSACPIQMSVTIMSNFNGFYVFPGFALNFSSPGYENVPGFIFCSSIVTISYLRQQTSFPVSSHRYFSLKIHVRWVIHGCYGLVCMNEFSATAVQTAGIC